MQSRSKVNPTHTHPHAGPSTYPGLLPSLEQLLVLCECTFPLVQVPGWNALLICRIMNISHGWTISTVHLWTDNHSQLYMHY